MMNLIFISGVCFKGIGAVLEMIIQIVLTRYSGLEGYGTYTTWVNFADLLFWGLFSGVVKCNTFYLSGGGKSLRNFRRKYYSRYVVPVLMLIMIIVALVGKPLCGIIPLIALLELMMFDKSSVLLTEGRYTYSLSGEYIIGRAVLLAGILIMHTIETLSIRGLLFLYVVQYIVVLLYFRLGDRTKRTDKIYQLRESRGHKIENDISNKVSLWKWWEYQRGDIIQSLVAQVPVILQYFLSGALEAGVLAVVLLVKRLINFISGPTSKVFLPEFSKLYHVGEKEKLRICFASIMKIQLLFVSPLAVILLGYPQIILRILAHELIPYANIFMMCSFVFLLAAMLGPCGGLMQMTENEKLDNRCREISIILMFLVFVLFHRHQLFAVYGLCIQTFVESVSKYVLVCRWFGKKPVRCRIFATWWIIPTMAILITYIMNLQKSFWMMVIMAGGTFLIQLFKEFRYQDLKELLYNRRNKG